MMNPTHDQTKFPYKLDRHTYDAETCPQCGRDFISPSCGCGAPSPRRSALLDELYAACDTDEQVAAIDAALPADPFEGLTP